MALGSAGKDQDKAAKEIVDAVKGGKPLPETNVYVTGAKSAIAAKPARFAEHSLIFQPSETPLYLRETSAGLVFLGFPKNIVGFAIGVFPTR
jgi:hypothetical protein